MINKLFLLVITIFFFFQSPGWCDEPFNISDIVSITFPSNTDSLNNDDMKVLLKKNKNEINSKEMILNFISGKYSTDQYEEFHIGNIDTYNEATIIFKDNSEAKVAYLPLNNAFRVISNDSILYYQIIEKVH